MEEDFTLVQACKRVHCTRHEEPISLICVADKCQTDRIFCLECFDGESPSDHVMVNIKKFNEIYEKFKNAGSDNSRQQIQISFVDFRKNVNQIIDELQKAAISSCSASTNLSNGQQQEIRGKLTSIVKSPIWAKILKARKENKSEDDIKQMLKKSSEGESTKLLGTLQVIHKNVLVKLRTGLELLSNSDKAENNRCFSTLQRCPTIQLLSNKKVAKNTTENGHYFVVCQDPITQEFCRRDFILKSYGSYGAASLWIGVTNPTISKKHNFTNIYDQGKGSHFVVFYDQGNSINIWNTAFPNALRSYAGQNFPSGTLVRVQVDFKKSSITFFAGPNQTLLKNIDVYNMPKNQKFYPAVGFFGTGEIEYL